MSYEDKCERRELPAKVGDKSQFSFLPNLQSGRRPCPEGRDLCVKSGTLPENPGGFADIKSYPKHPYIIVAKCWLQM